MSPLIHRRRPRPFVRLTRVELEEIVVGLETQRDDAIVARTETRTFVINWLTSRAHAYRLDASAERHTGPLTSREHAAVAHELEVCVRDLETGRDH